MRRGITEEGMKRIARKIDAVSDEETFAKVDLLLQYMSAEELVDSLVQAMDFEEANANLDFILRMHDIPSGGGME